MPKTRPSERWHAAVAIGLSPAQLARIARTFAASSNRLRARVRVRLIDDGLVAETRGQARGGIDLRLQLPTTDDPPALWRIR